MGYKEIHYFYNCYHCGELYYSNRIIKRKKCLSCHRSFQFQKSKKTSLRVTPEQAIKLLQILKKRRGEQRGFDFKLFLNKFK